MNACIDQDDSNQKLDALDLKDFLLQETLFYFPCKRKPKTWMHSSFCCVKAPRLSSRATLCIRTLTYKIA